MKRLGALVLTLAVAMAACTDDESETRPYLEFIGGGFIFNYRHAQADYGFVVKPIRRLPQGSVLEAVFENPQGGDPFVVRQSTKRGRTQYVFRTPPVRGVRANHDYHVEVRLLAPETQRTIASYRRTFRSDFDREVLPEQPTVVGPGHQPASPSGG